MKKLISIVLCLAMVISMASFTVFADAQAIADSISVDTITTETANLITKNLTLPTEIDGQSVTWVSSDESVITNAGVVTRHATEEKAVTLTATVGDATKEIPLTVAPLTTVVLYQNNFGKKSDGTPFDTSKELIGASASTTQIDSWKMGTAQNTAPFGSTVGATGGVLIDLNTRANSPTFSFPETMDSPFYVSFDVKTQSVSPGIDFRFYYTPEGGASTLQTVLRWDGGTTRLYAQREPVAHGGKNFASTETNKVRMCVYIDPINLIMKFMDANGKFIPNAGYKIGNADAKNGVITSMNFCRAGSTSPAGFIEFDNFAVYRTAAETQIYNDRAMLRSLAENVTFADFSDQDINAVTENLDFSALKNKIESENEGVTVSFASNNEEILKIDGTTGIITRPVDSTAVKVEIIVSRGDSKFGKSIEFTVKEAFNPAKQAADEIFFDLFTDEAIQAVTKNLDLSIADFYMADVAQGATVSFASSNPDVLYVDGDTGYISRSGEKTDVTLTATVSKEGRTFSKDFKMTVLPEGTYVFESENFGYPELLGESVGELPRWVITDNYSGGTSADIAKNNNGYYVESIRTKKTSAYDSQTFSFKGIRNTKKLTVEMDLNLNYIPAGTIYDINFLGVKDGGVTVTDIAKPLFYVRITNTNMRIFCSSDVERVVQEGQTRHLRFDFDFENNTFCYYVDGQRLKTDITLSADGAFEALSQINFRSNRNSENSKIGIDNLAVYSIDPEFVNSEVDDETKANRPMTVGFGSFVSGGTTYYQSTITTPYDEENNLSQKLVEKSETFTNNPIIDFYGGDLVDKASGKATSLNYIASDETNPQIINGLYIGSNHGAMGARVTSNAHGKTQADVGSVWKDANGTLWDLIRVEDQNKLFFLQHKTVDLATQNFGFNGNIAGPLSYVSDGVNTGEIAIGSFTATQTFPSIANVEHSFYLVRDGEMIPVDNKITGVSYQCDEYVIVEEYDIMNPAQIANALRENRPEGGYKEAPSIAVGQPIFHYKQILTVKADGTIFTEIDHTVLEQLYGYETYGYQYYPRNDIYGGGAWRQIPGTKEFTDGKGKTFDISEPIEYTLINGQYYTDKEYPQGITMTAKQWVDENVVPSRILDFYRDTEGKNVMGYMTGFLPIYMGEPETRKALSKYNIYMYDNKAKAYPYFVASSGIPVAQRGVLTAPGANIHGVSYRKYVDLRDFEENQTQYYSIDHEDMTYYYVDFASAGKQVIDLKSEGVLYDLTQVQVLGDITYSQVGDTIEVTSEGKGYLVLEASRQLEIESATVSGNSAFVRFVNYSDEAKTVNVTIASYDGNRLAGVKLSKNVEIDANSTLNSEFAVSGAGDTYKVFVFDADSSVAPVGKEVTAIVK